MIADHRVSVRIGSRAVENSLSYSIDNDMLSPADAFSLEFGPATRERFDLLRPDEAVQVAIDGTVVLTGFIDERTYSSERSGTRISISGRDKGGRLVDESMDLVRLQGGIKDIASRCVGDWFSSVTLQNTRDRILRRGRGARIALVSSEPVIVAESAAASVKGEARAILIAGASALGVRVVATDHAKKVDPGETRWQVLSHFLEEAGLLAWASADGQELVIGQPNYEQMPQYRFFLPREGSDRASECNVLSWRLVDSVHDRYARIVACGSGQGNTVNFSDRVIKLRGEAKDNAATVDGTGKAFSHHKSLLIADDDVRDLARAQIRAEREMALRNSTGRRLEVMVNGHSQRYANTDVLYAFDTMAEVEDETTGVRELWLIVSTTFERSRQGTFTRMTLVPKGTVLSQ